MHLKDKNKIVSLLIEENPHVPFGKHNIFVNTNKRIYKIYRLSKNNCCSIFLES
jgi:hypothetical protein